MLEDLEEERKKVNKEKEWSETLIELAPNIIVGLGEKSKIILFNKFAEKLTGYKAEEVLGKRWIEIFIPSAQKEELYKVWSRIVRDKSIEYQYINPIITKKGEERLIAWQNTAITENGEFKMVLSMGVDVTEKEKAQQVLNERVRVAQAQYSISKALDKYSDNIDDILSKVVNLLPEACRYPRHASALIVYNSHVVKSRNFRRSKWRHSVNVAVRGKKVGKIEIFYNKKIPFTLAEKSLLKTVAREIGTFKQRVVAGELEKKAAEETQEALQKTKQALEELKAIDEMKTEFVAIASHQLRTPLTSIIWYLETLSSGELGKLNKSQKEYMDLAHHGGIRLANLLDDLLNVSQLETGRMKIESVSVDLKQLIKKLIQEVKPLATKRKCKIIFKTTGTGPFKLMIDRALYREVAQNILSNAISYSPRGKGRVLVTLKKHKKEWQLIVKDNGFGISASEQKRVFEKFYRAKNAMKAKPGGTGLGLYIAKLIIETAGGKIWLDSQENRGTTVYVSLPASGMKRHAGEQHYFK